MKKFMKYIACTLTLSALVIVCMPVTYAHAINDDSSTELDNTNYETFEQLEQTIDKNLNIIDNKYVYNEEQRNNISSAIQGFNIDKFNIETSNSYTKDVLEKEIFENIDNADLTIKVVNRTNEGNVCSTRLYYCNTSYEQSGWNYYRYWTNEKETRNWASELSWRALLDSGLGFGSAFYGPAGLITSVGFTVHGAWCSSLSTALFQNATGCGARTDINKFTAIFTVDDQSDL